MKNAARQSLTDTLTELGRAMDKQRAVTIAYADADEAPSIRIIEIHDIVTGDDDGAVFVQSMDRPSGNFRGDG